MPGIFSPDVNFNIQPESPVAPVAAPTSFIEGALNLGSSFLATETRARRGSTNKADPNLAIFSEEMDKVAEIRASRGEMAGRLAERNVASNFAAAGIDLDASYKAVYETKTGRNFEAYGRDDAAAFRESLLKDDTVRASLTASLAILPPGSSMEDRLEFAIGEKARVESAALLVGRAKADATTNWTQAEGGYNAITDNFLSTSMGALVQREQSGVPITAQDIANTKVQWAQLKAGVLSRPSYLGDDQWKSFNSRLDQVDKMFAALEKASSNDVLRDSMTKYLADAINRSEGIEPTQKAVAVLGALSGDAAILSQLGGRFGDVAQAMSKAKVIELPSANIFGQALFAPGKPAPGNNEIVTKDDLPPEIAQKYGDMSAQERVRQMKADGTYSSLFSPANMGNPENREAFAQRAMSLGTTMLSGGTDEFLSPLFLREGVANPKFINSIKSLELQDADLGMKTRAIVRSGLLTERLRQNANLGSIENRIQGVNFNTQTGRYEINPEFFRTRQQDLAAFNADLNEFYRGDLAVAARDNFSKIEAKYAGFRTSRVSATNILRLGNFNSISEALKRRDAITVLDQAVDQLTTWSAADDEATASASGSPVSTPTTTPPVDTPATTPPVDTPATTPPVDTPANISIGGAVVQGAQPTAPDTVNVNEIARDPRTGEPIFPAQDELAVEVQNVLKNAGVPESPGLIDSIGKFLKDLYKGVKIPSAQAATPTPTPTPTPRPRPDTATATPTPRPRPSPPQGNVVDDIKQEIRDQEGFSSSAYVPTKGDVPTIGYGFTEGVKLGDSMTKAEAEQRLTKEVNKRLVAIRNKIPDFDTFPADAQVAMLSSWYRGSLSGSSKTIKLINKGSYAAAATEFLNNEEYKNAVARGRPGIRPRMEKTADAIRSLRQPEELEI